MARLLTALMPKRRWMQLSLRTVLVLVTLLCVALGLWIVPAERQRRAVAAIQALGGGVLYGKYNRWTNGGFPVGFLRRWLPQDYFDEVTGVSLNWTKSTVTDDGLVHLRGLTGVRRLDLIGTQVTDAGLAHLQGLTALQSLDLGGTQVTDAGLTHLQGLRGLQTLSLNNTQVTGTGLAHLRGLTSLQALHLVNEKFTDTGLAHLQGLTSLQELRLNGTQVTDAGLAHLKGLTGLRVLILINTQVTDAGVAELHQALPNCRQIDWNFTEAQAHF